MEAHSDPAVGSVRNNGPELTEPLEGHEPRIGTAKQQTR